MDASIRYAPQFQEPSRPALTGPLVVSGWADSYDEVMMNKTSVPLRWAGSVGRRDLPFLVGRGLQMSVALLCMAIPAAGFAERAAPSGVGDASAAEWPQFRGPDGQGHAAARDLPVRWSERKNIAWKVRIAGHGWSSPVIGGNQIWLTTADRKKKILKALCLDRTDGRILHEIDVFRLKSLGHIHSKNSYATPTPILEGDRVYVHFGSLGTACLSTDSEAALLRDRLSLCKASGHAVR